jgi:hypothetical protein
MTISARAAPDAFSANSIAAVAIAAVLHRIIKVPEPWRKNSTLPQDRLISAVL